MPSTLLDDQRKPWHFATNECPFSTESRTRESGRAPVINLVGTLMQLRRLREALDIATDGVTLSKELGVYRSEGAIYAGMVAECLFKLGGGTTLLRCAVRPWTPGPLRRRRLS